LTTARVGVTNPRLNNFKGHRTGFGSDLRNQPSEGRDRDSLNISPAVQLSEVVDSLPCTEVIEERNRMAREIHDTLAQQFAGILLHLEAANGLTRNGHALDFLNRARELAKCGLEDARRMLLGLRPKSLEGAHLSDALALLAQRFSRD